MAKHKKQRQDDSAEVPMSSMIDVVFLLLIFFIVTSKEVVDECHIAVNMPGLSKPSSSNEEKEQPTIIELALVSKAGTDDAIYLLSNREMPLSMISNQLTQIAIMDQASAPGQSTITVNIKTAMDVQSQHFVNLLSECKKAGLVNLNIFSLKDPIGRK